MAVIANRMYFSIAVITGGYIISKGSKRFKAGKDDVIY
jgi:hypothetical protein